MAVLASVAVRSAVHSLPRTGSEEDSHAIKPQLMYSGDGLRQSGVLLRYDPDRPLQTITPIMFLYIFGAGLLLNTSFVFHVDKFILSFACSAMKHNLTTKTLLKDFTVFFL